MSKTDKDRPWRVRCGDVSERDVRIAHPGVGKDSYSSSARNRVRVQRQIRRRERMALKQVVGAPYTSYTSEARLFSRHPRDFVSVR